MVSAKADTGALVRDIFATQAARFRPEAAVGVDAIIGYDLTGEGGGRWRLRVKDGGMKTEEVADLGPCTAVLKADADTFAGITLGTLDAAEMLAAGKASVQGDMKVVGLLARLFTKYVPARAAVTAADILATAPARLRADRAAGLKASVGYDLSGEGGGQWTVVIDGGACVLETGLRPDAAVVNVASARDFVDLMLGKLDPMTALGAGRLRLRGDMELAAQLPKLFARYVPPDAGPKEELIVLKRLISVGQRYATGPVMGRFLDGLKERKILANVCPRCGRRQVPPREVCAECRVRATEFREVGPEGVLVHVEVVYYSSPDPLTGATRETPYGDIRVLLDGCRGRETFWHLLKREDLFEVKRGDRVRPVWADERRGTIQDIVHFEKVRP